MSRYTIPPSHKQLALVRELRQKLGLGQEALNELSRKQFGQPYLNLDRKQVSALIDQMLKWEKLPADLQRAQGQLDLLGDTA